MTAATIRATEEMTKKFSDDAPFVSGGMSVEDTGRYTTVHIDASSRVISFREKAGIDVRALANGGVYIFRACCSSMHSRPGRLPVVIQHLCTEAQTVIAHNDRKQFDR